MNTLVSICNRSNDLLSLLVSVTPTCWYSNEQTQSGTMRLWDSCQYWPGSSEQSKQYTKTCEPNGSIFQHVLCWYFSAAGCRGTTTKHHNSLECCVDHRVCIQVVSCTCLRRLPSFAPRILSLLATRLERTTRSLSALRCDIALINVRN
jgi:hypothetical protein